MLQPCTCQGGLYNFRKTSNILAIFFGSGKNGGKLTLNQGYCVFERPRSQVYILTNRMMFKLWDSLPSRVSSQVEDK